ncbi:MAG: tRNA pseudouridine(13) synthase TruD [Thermoplasmata archaeon]|nr:tRNA pseudouridine(13) synthase TruD [Thermoplasmata archaeon]
MLKDEREIGIECFLTGNLPGIGGLLKVKPEDFVVVETAKLPEVVENGRYTIARIRTCNWETNKLVREFSRAMHISRKRIGFAGTKDKRAIAERYFWFDAPPELVKKINLKDVEILEMFRTNKQIEIGDVIENTFNILVRQPEASEIEKRVSQIYEEILKNRGFPNFFGIQRFGVYRPVTHIVGREIVRGRLEEAVITYIANPLEEEAEQTRQVREKLAETLDFLTAAKEMPDSMLFERAIAQKLAEHPGDYAGALRVLPKNLLMMFVHAYQSFLFNRILSRRIKRFGGNTLEIGDIVLPVKNGIAQEEQHIPVRASNYSTVSEKWKQGKCVVSGIVFGAEPVFAEGEPGEIEREVIEEEHLAPVDFIIPEIPEVSSKGTRRGFFVQPKNFEWIVEEKGVRFRFSLPKGTYATSLLREFMKSRPENYG